MDMREMQRLAEEVDRSGTRCMQRAPDSEMDRLRRLADEAEHTPDVHSMRAEMKGTAVREYPSDHDPNLQLATVRYPENYLEDGGQVPVLVNRAKKVRSIHGYMPLPKPMPLAR